MLKDALVLLLILTVAFGANLLGPVVVVVARTLAKQAQKFQLVPD